MVSIKCMDVTLRLSYFWHHRRGPCYDNTNVCMSVRLSTDRQFNTFVSDDPPNQNSIPVCVAPDSRVRQTVWWSTVIRNLIVVCGDGLRWCAVFRQTRSVLYSERDPRITLSAKAFRRPAKTTATSVTVQM